MIELAVRTSGTFVDEVWAVQQDSQRVSKEHLVGVIFISSCWTVYMIMLRNSTLMRSLGGVFYFLTTCHALCFCACMIRRVVSGCFPGALDLADLDKQEGGSVPLQERAACR